MFTDVFELLVTSLLTGAVDGEDMFVLLAMPFTVFCWLVPMEADAVATDAASGGTTLTDDEDVSASRGVVVEIKFAAAVDATSLASPAAIAAAAAAVVSLVSLSRILSFTSSLSPPHFSRYVPSRHFTVGLIALRNR